MIMIIFILFFGRSYQLMVNWWFVVVWIPRIPLYNGLLGVSLESQPPTQTKKLAEVIGKPCFLLTVSFLGGESHKQRGFANKKLHGVPMILVYIYIDPLLSYQQKMVFLCQRLVFCAIYFGTWKIVRLLAVFFGTPANFGVASRTFNC